MQPAYESSDLLVFSHLRWDFVFQRPQHLMTRFAKQRRVFYFEEPIFTTKLSSTLISKQDSSGVIVVTPHLSEGCEVNQMLTSLLREFLLTKEISSYACWYYTPMALSFTQHLEPEAVMYDCMDELSLFKGAPPSLLENEAKLFNKAHLVFTGGRSLYEAKKKSHTNIHPFPSSIDYAHFAKARTCVEPEPEDQRQISGTKVGFFGVVDERMDLELLDKASALRPDLQWIIIGPVVKIDPAHLPRRANIHYLGGKSYQELPQYLAGWDVALMPFARNDSTKFISPTKTPEYLAAGRPVVSTSIRDVIHPYAFERLVHIADTAEDFVQEIDLALLERQNSSWLRRVDAFLADKSWDSTWAAMATLENQILKTSSRSSYSRRKGLDTKTTNVLNR